MKTDKPSFMKCVGTKTIADINEKYNYDDEYPQGVGDSPKVACGQKGSYNELEYIYDNVLSKFVDAGDITESEAIDALCMACEELPNPRERKDFYAFLSDVLEISI